MKKKITTILILVTIIVSAQFIRPDDLAKYQNNGKIEDLAGVPKSINQILRNSCFNCHSSSVELEWFDKITPINFLVASHIRKGNEVLNFSNWVDFPVERQKALLYASINKIIAEEMPLPSYSLAHPNTKLNEKQIQLIKSYLLKKSPRTKANTFPINVAEKAYNKDMKAKQFMNDYKEVLPSLNGISYIPEYKNWKAISTTDRFDNGTMRIIFANDIAVSAIQSKNINPWPDGSVLAKAAWKQNVASDGTISTGKFVQVEYMIKDSNKYKKTQGWGWARWKGEKLIPYGKTVNFSSECISCHSPVRKNDNVFTIPINLK